MTITQSPPRVVATIGYSSFPMPLPENPASPAWAKLNAEAASDALIGEYDVLRRESVATRRASMKAGHLVALAAPVFSQVHPRCTAQAIEAFVTMVHEDGGFYVDEEFELEASLTQWGALSLTVRINGRSLYSTRHYHIILSAKRGGVQKVVNHGFYSSERIRKDRERLMASALREVSS